MPKLDVTKQSVRVRQRPPSAFTRGSFRTITISVNDDIRAVVGCPLPGRESDKRRTKRDSNMRRTDVDRLVQAFRDKGYHAKVISYGRDVSRYDLSPAAKSWMNVYRREGATPEVRDDFASLSRFDQAAIRFLLTENGNGGAESRDRGRRRSRARDRLSTRGRERLRSSQFALPEQRRLPIHNAAHARNASARLEQMKRRGSITRAQYARARRAIDRAERRFGVDTSRPLGR